MPKALVLGADPSCLAIAAACLRRGIVPVILETSGSIEGERELTPPARRVFCSGRWSVLAEVHFRQWIRAIYFIRNELCSIHAINPVTGEMTLFAADYFFFSTPLDEMVTAMNHVPGYRFLPERAFANVIKLSDYHALNA